jgi:hypothetical protein
MKTWLNRSLSNRSSVLAASAAMLGIVAAAAGFPG